MPDASHVQESDRAALRVLRTDFNDIAEGAVWAYSNEGVLPLGIRVALDDGEGLRCQARLKADAMRGDGGEALGYYIAEIIPDTWEHLF